MNTFSIQLLTMIFFLVIIISNSKAHHLCLLCYSDNHNLKSSFTNFLKIYFLLTSDPFKLIEDSVFSIFYSLRLGTYFHKLFPNSSISCLYKFAIFLVHLVSENIYIGWNFNFHFLDLKDFDHVHFHALSHLANFYWKNFYEVLGWKSA